MLAPRPWQGREERRVRPFGYESRFESVSQGAGGQAETVIAGDTVSDECIEARPSYVAAWGSARCIRHACGGRDPEAEENKTIGPVDME